MEFFFDPTENIEESDSATTETSSADEQSTEGAPLQPAKTNTDFENMWGSYFPDPDSSDARNNYFGSGN